MYTVTGSQDQSTVTVTRETQEDAYRTAQHMQECGYTVSVNGVRVVRQ